MMRSVRAILAVTLAALLWTGSALAQTAAPVVERLNAALLDAMRNAQSLGYRGRAQRLGPVLFGAYDIATMGRVAVGARWNGASEAQRAEIVDLFGRFTVANYAARFDGYAGERFEIVDEREAGQNRLVRTRIVRASGNPVQINYLLARSGQGYRIVDVFLDSTISEVATRRSEFSSILARGGFAELAQTLRDRIARFEQTAR